MYTQEKNQTSDSDRWVVAGRIADWTDRVSADPVEKLKEKLRILFQEKYMGKPSQLGLCSQGVHTCPEAQL